MAEVKNDNIEFIKKRVDTMKPESSAYNYYLNTPLSELKTREEKLIKQEIQARILNENKKNNSGNVENINNYQMEIINENNNVINNNSVKTLSESDDKSSLSPSLFSYITDAFKKAGVAVESTVTFIGNKLSSFEKRLSESSNSMIKWIPTIVKSAIGVLIIAYCWNKFKNKVTDGKEATSESNINDTAACFMISAINGIGMLTEASIMASGKKNKSIFGALNGRCEELSNNIVERAKYVANDLINDSEFITFSKKNSNNDLLKEVKKFASMSEKEEKKKEKK